VFAELFLYLGIFFTHGRFSFPPAFWLFLTFSLVNAFTSSSRHKTDPCFLESRPTGLILDVLCALILTALWTHFPLGRENMITRPPSSLTLLLAALTFQY